MRAAQGTRARYGQQVALLAPPVTAVALLAYRITIGVDLSDESYYLSFIDGWLKTGIAAGKAMVIHQTAALPIHPFARLYELLRGGSDGLALFLRAMYLLAACAAGLSFAALARLTHGRIVAAFAFVLVVSFVPFGLPAPSYNTLGLFGSIAALSAWGIGFKRGSTGWLVLSAFAWGVATLAYPTMLVVLAALLTATLAMPRLGPRSVRRRYVAWSLAVQALGLCAVLAVFGSDRLAGMLAFSNASLQVSDGIGAKLARAAGMLTGTRGFAALCLAGLVLGAARARAADTPMAGWLLGAGIAALLAAAHAIGPALYAKTHDYVFLLGLVAAGWLPVRLARRTAPFDAILSTGLSLGIFAGLVTSLTATNGLVNFAVGGFCGVAFFLLAAAPSGPDANRTAHAATLGVTACFLLQGAFAFVYGEQNDVFAADARRVRGGVFDGLLTTAEKAAALPATSRFLARLPGDSVVALGRMPGIYLLTDKRPMALSTWDFGQQNGPVPAMEAAIARFFAQPQNRPALVLVVSDRWTRPPSSAGLALLSHYRPLDRLDTPVWSIEAYGR